MVLEKPPAKKVFQQEDLETIKLHLHDVPFNDIEVLKAHKTKLCKETRKAFHFMLFCMVSGKCVCVCSVHWCCVSTGSSPQQDENRKSVLTHKVNDLANNI